MYRHPLLALVNRYWLLGVLLLSAVCSPALTPCWAEESADAATIQSWVTQLDDNLFDTRETAQEQLEQAGLSALDAVAQESQHGSLESATRAINILLFWSESPDRVTRVAALEKLITLPNRPKESTIASELLADAREEEALEAIVKLGGYHTIPPHMKLRSINRRHVLIQVVIGKDWKGGDAGLKHLAAVPHATVISFHSSPIEDSAIAQLLELKSVRRFEFYGTPKVSKAARDKLQQHHPLAKIDVRSGARLGIQGDLTGSANIRAIIENSAADKAGLKVNDLITELNGEKIQDFTVLTKRIGQHQPGDSVELTVIRNRKPQKITVTFDQWGLNAAQLRNLNGNLQNPNKNRPAPPPIRLDRR